MQWRTGQQRADSALHRIEPMRSSATAAAADLANHPPAAALHCAHSRHNGDAHRWQTERSGGMRGMQRVDACHCRCSAAQHSRWPRVAFPIRCFDHSHSSALLFARVFLPLRSARVVPCLERRRCSLTASSLPPLCRVRSLPRRRWHSVPWTLPRLPHRAALRMRSLRSRPVRHPCTRSAVMACCTRRARRRP